MSVRRIVGTTFLMFYVAMFLKYGLNMGLINFAGPALGASIGTTWLIVTSIKKIEMILEKKWTFWEVYSFVQNIILMIWIFISINFDNPFIGHISVKDYSMVDFALFSVFWFGSVFVDLFDIVFFDRKRISQN